MVAEGAGFERLSGLDGAFLALETSSAPLHVGAVIVLSPAAAGRPVAPSDEPGAPGAPTEQDVAVPPDVEAELIRCAAQVPALRRRVLEPPFGFGRPVWVDDPGFTVANHLRCIRLPSPGHESGLWPVMADAMSRPLDRHRPLWETTVVEGLTGGRRALVVTLHHALLDGESGTALLMALFDPSSPGPTPIGEDPPDGGHLPAPSLAAQLRLTAMALAEETAATWRSVGRFATAVRAVTAHRGASRRSGERALTPTPLDVPATSLNGTPSHRRRYAVAEVPLEELRRISKRFDATVNDVVLATVSSAVRTVLAGRGEVPPRPLVALVPVSIRGERAPSEQLLLGNELAAMLVSLATDEPDPRKRLLAVAASSRAAKEQLHHAGRGVLRDTAQIVPPGLLWAAARGADAIGLFDHVPPLFNLAVSTVVGPPTPLTSPAGLASSLYPAGPIGGGTGLNVSALTYAGTVHFGLLGCSRLVPELDAIPDMIVDAISELREAAA